MDMHQSDVRSEKSSEKFFFNPFVHLQRRRMTLQKPRRLRALEATNNHVSILQELNWVEEGVTTSTNLSPPQGNRHSFASDPSNGHFIVPTGGHLVQNEYESVITIDGFRG